MTNKMVTVTRLLLTYPQCDKTPRWLIEKLKTLDNYGGCITATEDHKETEGKHLHSYFFFNDIMKMRANTLNSKFDFEGYHPNIELVRKGRANIDRVVRYVIKDGNYLCDNCNENEVMFEKTVKRSAKEVLETNMKKLVEGNDINPIHMKSLLWAQTWWKLMQRPADHPKNRGIWIQGPTGTGKTYWAREFGEQHGGLYIKEQNKWWDGYDGEKVVVLDDLDIGALCHFLKIWGDRASCKGEVKGGIVWLNYDYFIVTSNYSIEEIVNMNRKRDEPFDEELCGAIKRRFLVRDTGKEPFEMPEGAVEAAKLTAEEVFYSKKPPASEDNNNNSPSLPKDNNPLKSLDGSGYQ